MKYEKQQRQQNYDNSWENLLVLSFLSLSCTQPQSAQWKHLRIEIGGKMLQHQSQQSEMEHECKKQNKFHSNEEMNEERKINCLQNDSHHQIKY